MDTVYYNGKIITCEGNSTAAAVQAVAVRDGKILAVGSDEAVLSMCDGAERINLMGLTVLPGLFESHTHFIAQGEFAMQINASSLDEKEILDNVRTRAQSVEPDEWLEGRCGFRCESWLTDTEGFVPLSALDAAAPDNPVVIYRNSGLAVRANSRALHMAGVAPDAPLYGDTGLSAEVSEALERAKPAKNEAYYKKVLLRAQAEMFSFGVTSCLFVMASKRDRELLEKLYTSGDMKMRVNIAYGAFDPPDTVESFREYCSAPPRRGLYGDRFADGMIKLFADGTFGAHTAALTSDYTDMPGCVGKLNYSDEELYRIVAEAGRTGYQIAVHTVGDRAMQQILRICGRVIGEQGLKDHRFRIEHLQLIDPRDPQRMKELGLVASMQAAHAPYNREMTLRRLGEERVKWVYALKPVLDEGVVIAGGSDAPVQSANPFEGIYAAVTRKCMDGEPEGGYQPQNDISREAALLCYTAGGAYGLFTESTRGTLEPGKDADFTVIDRDFMTCDAEELKSIRPLLTVCGGERVYASPFWRGA